MRPLCRPEAVVLVIGGVLSLPHTFKSVFWTTPTPWRVTNGAFLLLAVVMVKLAVRRLRPSADEMLTADQRAPILYLRPFAQDNSTLITRGRFGWDSQTEDFEEILRKETASLGALVAVGRPGEFVPPLGAARKYLSDSEWHEWVKIRIPGTSLIVIGFGASAGILSELELVVEERAAARLLVVRLPGSRFSEDGWRAWRRILPALPEFRPELDSLRAFEFDVDGKVRLNETAESADGYRSLLRECVERRHEHDVLGSVTRSSLGSHLRLFDMAIRSAVPRVAQLPRLFLMMALMLFAALWYLHISPFTVTLRLKQGLDPEDYIPLKMTGWPPQFKDVREERKSAASLCEYVGWDGPDDANACLLELDNIRLNPPSTRQLELLERINSHEVLQEGDVGMDTAMLQTMGFVKRRRDRFEVTRKYVAAVKYGWLRNNVGPLSVSVR